MPLALVLEACVPNGGQAALEEFLRDAAPYYADGGRNVVRLHWDAADPRRFRETIVYPDDAAFAAADEATRSDPRMRAYLERWHALLDGEPRVSLWREASLG